VGTAFNVWGRVHLGANWADHVRIYTDQTLVTGGPYRFVRHPLYASLVWMFYGASLAYLNPLAALETTLIFLPGMWYRSNLEEAALLERFGDAYRAYRARTGRFLPRPGRLAP
jgi:protein-S-isoprenylcysteine O-methyltransferase Ste14